MKALASKTTYFMYLKYSQPAKVEGASRPFAKRFMARSFVPLLESHLQLLFQKKTDFVGSTALTYSLKFVTMATHSPATFEKLKPYIETLLYDCIVPLMFVTEADLTLFREEPVEFIRNEYHFEENHQEQVHDLCFYLNSFSSKKQEKEGKATTTRNLTNKTM